MLTTTIWHLKRCCKQTFCIPCGSNEIYAENKKDDFVIYSTLINFSKMGVPFRNTMLIRPLYNTTSNTPVFLMGISYLDAALPPLHITPSVCHLDDLIEDVYKLPFSIVVTSAVAPFFIQLVNKKWEDMTGYKTADAVGKTFSFLQERGENKSSIQLKNKILLNLASFDKWF
jgi:hypothetical protein